jgi:hypothetical protein
MLRGAKCTQTARCRANMTGAAMCIHHAVFPTALDDSHFVARLKFRAATLHVRNGEAVALPRSLHPSKLRRGCMSNAPLRVRRRARFCGMNGASASAFVAPTDAPSMMIFAPPLRLRQRISSRSLCVRQHRVQRTRETQEQPAKAPGQHVLPRELSSQSDASR